MNFDPSIIKTFRQEADATLAALGKKHGFSIRCGNATYDDGGFVMKLEVRQLAEDGKVISKEATDFIRAARLLGMKKEDLGRQFKIGTTEYQLEGYLVRGQRFNFTAKRIEDGKLYRLPEDAVKKALGY